MTAMQTMDVGMYSTAEEIDRLTAAIDLLEELEDQPRRYGFKRARDALMHLRDGLLGRLDDEMWSR